MLCDCSWLSVRGGVAGAVGAFDDSGVVMLDEAVGVGDAAVDADGDGAVSVAAEGVGASVVAVVLGAVVLGAVMLGAVMLGAVMLGAGALGALSSTLGSGEAFGAVAASLVERRSLSLVVEVTLAVLDALREAFAPVFVDARTFFGASRLLGAAAGSGDSMATLVLALSLPLSASVVSGAAGAFVSATVG